MKYFYLTFILLFFSMRSMAEDITEDMVEYHERAEYQEEGPGQQKKAEGREIWTQVNLYLFAVAIDGDTNLNGIESDVDVSFSDILDNLDLGGMVFVEHRRDKWSFIVDGLFMDLSDESSVSTNGVLDIKLEADVLQALAEAFVGYRVLKYDYHNAVLGIDLLGGARYNYIELELSAEASGLGLTTSASRKRDEEWVDAVIAIRFQYTHDNNWGATLWTDIGEGSDSSSYQILGLVNYRFENNISVFGGYRYYHMEYETGSGTNAFELDLDYSGPMIGLGYRF